MSPTEEKVLLTVDIQANNARLVELTGELRKAKAEYAELQALQKAGKLTAEQLDGAQVKLATTTKQITQEAGILAKANAQQTLANKAATGSTEQLRAQYALSATALSKLSTDERENTVAGQKLQAQTKALNDELRKQEAAYGNNARAVGDYNKGVKDVNVVSGQLTGGLQTAVSQGLSPFQATLDRGTGLFSKFKSGAELVKTGLAALKPAGEEGAGGFKAVAAGIALTGIGVFVLVLGTVISYFTQTNEGGKLLKQGLAALGAVVTTVANGITGAGKGLVQAFKDPQVALQDLLGFLKDQVVNRLAAFGLLIDGIRNRDFKKITDSVIQFNLGITNGTAKISAYANGIGQAATNAAELEQRLQGLKKSRADLEVDEVKEKGRVDELIRLSKDRTLSAADRLNKLREAGRLEAELSKKSLDLITEEEAALVKRNAAKGLSTTAEEIQEERDKRREFNATVAERNGTLATIKARQSRFILEERAELAKDTKERASAAQKAREDVIKGKQTEVERQLLEVVKGSAAELVLLQRKLDLAAALALASDKKTAADRGVLLETVEVEKQKLQADFDQKRAAAAKTEQKREYDENLGLLQQYLDQKRLDLEKERATGLMDEKTYQQRILQQDRAALAAKLVLAREYKQDTNAIEKQITAAQLTELHTRTAAEEAENAQRLGTAAAFGQQLGSLFAKTLLDTGSSLEDFAAKTLILLLDELEKFILAQEAKTLARAIATSGPLGIVEAAGEIALITAGFEVAKAALSQPKPKAFATGGIVPGTGTGDTVPILATGQEIIMNKASSVANAPYLSYLNSLYGGANFAPGFNPNRMLPPHLDGGLAARNAGAAAFPTAAQIGAAVAANVPTSIQVDNINSAQAKHAKVRVQTSLY
jgi:hypothetical protein